MEWKETAVTLFFSTRFIHHRCWSGRKVAVEFFRPTKGVVRLKNASVAWSVRVRPAIPALLSLPRLPRLDSRPRELLRQASTSSSRSSEFRDCSERNKTRYCLQLRSRVSDRCSSNIFALPRERDTASREGCDRERGLGRTDEWLAGSVVYPT